MRARRTLAVSIALLTLGAVFALAPTARAANPSSGSLRAPGDRVTWTGGPFTGGEPDGDIDCPDPANRNCDRFAVSVAPQSGPTTLVVTITTANGVVDDYDLVVFGPDGKKMGESGAIGTPSDGESVAIGLPDPGTFSVRVRAYAVAPGSTYRGEAKLVEGGEKTFGEGPEELRDCFDLEPDEVGIRGVTDDGSRVSVDVTVLLDGGVSDARAREVMTYARRSYDPLAIDLNVTRYVRVSAPSDGTAVRGGVTVGRAEGNAMIRFSKSVFGGARPPDSDVVYLLTDKELYSADAAEPDGRDENLLGLADCIGGVRFDQNAFAIGELADDVDFAIGPTTFQGNAGSKIASHEIGHLLGAHHHYFNCAEGAATETADQREVSPCTIMAPFVDLGSINFGVVDGAVVRGYAFEFARANDALAASARATAERASAAGGGGGGAGGNRGPGYALLGQDGGLFTFGAAEFHGSTGNLRLNQPVVGMAWTPSGKGYWLVARDGGIFTFGDAAFHGSTGGSRLNAPVLGMEATPSGKGYWLVAGDGGIFTFGDATFQGSTGDRKLNAPVVGLNTSSTGKGYWLVANDGGIFTFGDAAFHGSTGDRRLNEPVFDLASTATDRGYWLVARDGGVFTFGDAVFHGSAAAARQPAVVGLDATTTDRGYWIARSNGVVANFGDAPALGDLSGRRLNAPIVGFAASPS